jgi:hypothetical protein
MVSVAILQEDDYLTTTNCKERHMSDLKSTPSASTSDKLTIAAAVSLLAAAAQKNFRSVKTQLEKAGFGITACHLPRH